MLKLIKDKVYYKKGEGFVSAPSECGGLYKNTMAWQILSAHNSGDEKNFRIKFDALASHDITYVGIIQTARASGLTEFPIPYVLTNCHNSLCAVGGTINEDDHVFGYTAAVKYGGIFVPAHQAVIHSYVREQIAACGKMVLGSDSHTRYGALGCMGVGEGGPELVKQLLSRTYDIARPEVTAVLLKGEPRPGVGPQDVALALVGAVFGNGFVKNKVLEFVGSGISSLPIDFRCGIDVMTTETTCLSSIWETDEITREYYKTHLRESDYRSVAPVGVAEYDSAVVIDLSEIEPMIALPFHPSNVYTIREFTKNAAELLDGVAKEIKSSFGLSADLRSKITSKGVLADQAVIAGCAGGTFDNLMAACDILGDGEGLKNPFTLNLYCGSQPIYTALCENGAMSRLVSAGAVMKTSFCGPCFGAGDVPANLGLSIRHTTRNFPNREGSKPREGQIASVALMDARSIAMSARNGGIITPADEHTEIKSYAYHYNPDIYKHRIYDGRGRAKTEEKLVLGPNIADWPAITPLRDNMLLKTASLISDSVTTTDELIPSGETSSYRSNPLRLAEFTLSRKDPAYVGKAKDIARTEADGNLPELFDMVKNACGIEISESDSLYTSCVCALKPGDGSAREQAASCQRVLGGGANIAVEYATKRYRSNLINWGMLPLLLSREDFSLLSPDCYILIPGILKAVAEKLESFDAYIIKDGRSTEITLSLGSLTDDEREIIIRGCLINYYSAEK